MVSVSYWYLSTDLVESLVLQFPFVSRGWNVVLRSGFWMGREGLEGEEMVEGVRVGYRDKVVVKKPAIFQYIH